MYLFCIGLLKSANHALSRLAARTQQLQGEHDPPPTVVPYLGARPRPSQVLDVGVPTHAKCAPPCQLQHKPFLGCQICFPSVSQICTNYGTRFEVMFGSVWKPDVEPVWEDLVIFVCQIRQFSEHFGVPHWLPFWAHPIWELFSHFASLLGARFGSIFGPQKWVPKMVPY